MNAKFGLFIGTALACLATVAALGFSSNPFAQKRQGYTSGATQETWSRGDKVLETAKKPAVDLTGDTRIGKASFYASFFSGRKMADGKLMNPQTNNAASRTLPLGTTAKVTNLETGKSAVVKIQDRGPYVDGRIVDLSPATAQKIGITRRLGIAKVEVTPISLPLPDGSIKLGAAARDPEVAMNWDSGRNSGDSW